MLLLCAFIFASRRAMCVYQLKFQHAANLHVARVIEILCLQAELDYAVFFGNDRLHQVAQLL